MSKYVNRYTLAIIIVIGWIVITVQQIYTKGPGGELIIGAWISAISSVIGYFFGTTQSSQHKTDLLARAQPIDADATQARS